MSKASYSYEIVSFRDSEILVIEDLNTGGMSVTNDMENVLSEIADEIGHSLNGHRIIYKDSYGKYDGVALRNGQMRFVILQKNDLDTAIEVYLKKESQFQF